MRGSRPAPWPPRWVNRLPEGRPRQAAPITRAASTVAIATLLHCVRLPDAHLRVTLRPGGRIRTKDRGAQPAPNPARGGPWSSSFELRRTPTATEVAEVAGHAALFIDTARRTETTKTALTKGIDDILVERPSRRPAVAFIDGQASLVLDGPGSLSVGVVGTWREEIVEAAPRECARPATG